MTGRIQAKRRWGFRTRLTALIAAVFVTGGAVLLGVQYLLVRGLFDSAIGGIAGCLEAGITVVTGDDVSDAECQAIVAVSGAVDGAVVTAGDDGQAIITVGDAGQAILIEQTTMLSREVLSGLLLWSVVVLLGFTAIAVVVASWLSRRSFARIGRITATTQRITRDDLHQRLDLPGPADEIKELGDTIDTMLDRLETAFTQQARFITNASHELRTPLTTTRTALEIPLAQGQVPEALEPPVRRALDANQRSEDLIAALLRLARTTAAGADVPGPPVELRSIAERSIAERQDEIRRLRLTVAADLAAASAAGVDPVLADLAVGNLLDNAIRHNDPGGTLGIATGGSDGRAWVEITNSGGLLTEEEAARLIEPFNRGAGTRTAAGGRSLGLGLTLVHNIATTSEAILTLVPVPSGGLAARIEWLAGP